MRPLRAAALLLLLATSLSACDLTVRIATRVDPGGGGEFGITMLLDRELVERLGEAGQVSDGSDISSLEQLFDGLAAKGWRTTRSEPSGGLLLQAQRSFADSADFDRALAELAGARGGDEQPIGLGSLAFDYGVDRSLLRAEARFDGRIDLSFGEDPSPVLVQLADLLRQSVHFEITAQLPGSMEVHAGGGSVEGDTIVWRPQVGQATSFAASASQLKTASLLAIMLPGMALLALAGWFLMGRRGGSAAVPAPEPAPDHVIELPEAMPHAIELPEGPVAGVDPVQ